MKKCKLLLVIVMTFFFSMSTLAQMKISGKVTEAATGKPLSGTTVTIKGTTRGTSTNTDGDYAIEVSSMEAVLVFSYTGYGTLERKVGTNTVLNIALIETAASLQDVVVTGVFDSRRKLEASVSISTLNAQQIERQAPNSGADLLRKVPGVFVNSAKGEVRTDVYTRGLANRPSYNDDVSGLYYVSLQEDGLPLSNVYINSYTHDLFLRADATLNRLEAVRGGTASIAGANAPGGIFNYLSKTGGSKFSGVVKEKLGLEGDGRNFYHRTDLNVGGPISKNGWYYNIGGFYRHAKGARDVGYPLNYGGQVKANIQKKYAGGSVTFYAKYLNDHNGTFLNLIGRNFDHPELAPGIKKTDAFILPAEASVSSKLGDGVPISFDPKDLNHSREFAIGADWKHTFGHGFTLQNNAKFSAKRLTLNITQATSPTLLTDLIPNAVAGTIGMGTITYKDNITKQPLAVVQASVSQTGPPSWTVVSNNMPSQDILKNGMLYQAAVHGEPKINEFLDQLVLTKKAKNISYNLGAFIGLSNLPRYSGGIVGTAFTTLENRPRMMDITYQNAFLGGATQQITSPEGYFKTGGVFGYNDFEYKKTNLAPFLAFNWQITPKLNFDLGVRYEHTISEGTNYIRVPNNGSDGGLDGNPLTTYDNNYYKNPLAIPYKFTTNTWSYSGAFNYLLADNQSIYVRYSEGRKAPEANLFQSIDAPEKVALTNPAVQNVTQVELGYKYKSSKIDLAITPYYSLLSNIFTGFTSLDSAGKLYSLTPYYNKLRSIGVEAEATIYLSNHFNTRVAATFQNATFPQYKISTSGATSSKSDDSTLDYSGNQADLSPDVILNITPTYSTEKFYAFLSYQYTGKRWANVPNAFQLPSFSLFDLGIGYNVTKRLSLNANINNLFNSFGVMTWGAPGGFPAVYNLSEFTKEKVEANKDALFPIGGTQPRAYFLTATYKF
ncbi:TonB-dependent receptor [Chitinophagaceae bacterium LB-8]|uniref:TonB-dependent receptor n=1 Tax=Paraflavisolibacter caeni TaxID=2982496 RepID=A0A9X2XUY5_9BACT|nr:TonB-dependent receptor [Paraflavisolibacter caeni]MCU7549769.1 TonB-dependent receptor [Paraflavisolibacter caeni]